MSRHAGMCQKASVACFSGAPRGACRWPGQPRLSARLLDGGGPRQRHPSFLVTYSKGFGSVEKADSQVRDRAKLTRKVFEKVVLEVAGGSPASCVLGCALLTEALRAAEIPAVVEDGYLVFNDEVSGRTAIWHAWVVADGNILLDVATFVNILNTPTYADIYGSAVCEATLPEGVRRGDDGSEQEQAMVAMHRWAAAQLKAGTYWQQALPQHLEMRRKVEKAIKPLLKRSK